MNIARLIAAGGCFDGPRGLRHRAHSRVPISGVATKKKKCKSGCYDHRGCLRQVGAFIGAADTPGAAARSRHDGHGIGPRSRVGVKSSVSPLTRSHRGAVLASPSSRSPCGLSSSSGPAAFVAITPLWGLSETSWHSRAFWFGAGSFDGPSNTRCNRRAAQGHLGESQRCSSAARG